LQSRSLSSTILVAIDVVVIILWKLVPVSEPSMKASAPKAPAYQAVIALSAIVERS
jgi:hypothetical protein